MPITSALTRLLRPHGRLFVYDFDWDAYDDRAGDWLAEHDSSDADNPVAGWQREHGSLHTEATINEALDVCFKRYLRPAVPISPGCWHGTISRRTRSSYSFLPC